MNTDLNVEKGYFRITLPDRKEEIPKTFPFIDKFDGLCGKIILSWKTLQPFGIANGLLTLKKEAGKTEAVFQFYRLKDRILLPGSSLKGMVRTYLAAIFGLNFADELLGDCKYGSVENNQQTTTRRLEAGHASKVFFEDVFLETKALSKCSTKQAFSKNKEVENTFRIYKIKASEELKTSGAPMECLPAGSTFIMEMQYLGLKEEHLIALLVSLGLHQQHSFPLKCGRGKSSGFGALEGTLQQVWQFPKNSTGSALLPLSPLTEQTETCRNWLKNPLNLQKEIIENLRMMHANLKG